MIRIAYLILCHIDPQHIARLGKKLTQDKDCEVFVHVDQKSDLGPFAEALSGMERVHLLQKRISVSWGGYSAIEATILLMQQAMDSGDFERLVLLQGLEYPIRSQKELRAFFEENRHTEFLRSQNISITRDIRQYHKYRLNWMLDQRKQPLGAALFYMNALLLKAGIVPHFKKNYAVAQDGRRLEIHQGCAQFGVTREAAEYILQFHRENPQFNRYFQRVYAPDEAYFHTILFNSAFIGNTPDGRAVPGTSLCEYRNLTYFEYPDEIVEFTKVADWPKLRDSGFLFFRKASSKSKELLDYIDQVQEGAK